MTNREILARAIDKANYGGYESPPSSIFKQPEVWSSIIFSHSFAIAFWGEKLTCLNLYAKEPPFADEMVHVPAFAYHLQRMVLEENPISYLEKFL